MSSSISDSGHHHHGPRIVKLKKGTMLTWKSQRLTYLAARDLDQYLTKNTLPPSDPAVLRVFRRDRAKVMEAIQSNIEIED